MLLLSACAAPAPGGPPSETPVPGSPGTRFQTTSPLPPLATPSGSPVALPETRLAAIRASLTARGVDAEQLRVVSAESVTFNDGSLGCPTPGVQYTQAQVNGMRVVVQAAGQLYDYRFGAGDTPRLCLNAAPRSASPTR